MRLTLNKLYEKIRKYRHLISILDVTKYPMTAMEYRRALNSPKNSYVNGGLKKLCILGVLRMPAKARCGKVYVLTETGEEIKKERCRELSREYDYYDPSMKDCEYKAYSKVAVAGRRREVVRVMRQEFQTLTQIYKRTSGFLFRKVSESLRELVRFGLAVQENPKGRYKLNKKGLKIRDFINKINEIKEKQQLRESLSVSNLMHRAPTVVPF
jgi:predicted transcriptional regulator